MAHISFFLYDLFFLDFSLVAYKMHNISAQTSSRKTFCLRKSNVTAELGHIFVGRVRPYFFLEPPLPGGSKVTLVDFCFS